MNIPPIGFFYFLIVLLSFNRIAPYKNSTSAFAISSDSKSINSPNFFCAI